MAGASGRAEPSYSLWVLSWLSCMFIDDCSWRWCQNSPDEDMWCHRPSANIMSWRCRRYEGTSWLVGLTPMKKIVHQPTMPNMGVPCGNQLISHIAGWKWFIPNKYKHGSNSKISNHQPGRSKSPPSSWSAINLKPPFGLVHASKSLAVYLSMTKDTSI